MHVSLRREKQWQHGGDGHDLRWVMMEHGEQNPQAGLPSAVAGPVLVQMSVLVLRPE